MKGLGVHIRFVSMKLITTYLGIKIFAAYLSGFLGFHHHFSRCIRKSENSEILILYILKNFVRVYFRESFKSCPSPEFFTSLLSLNAIRETIFCAKKIEFTVLLAYAQNLIK